MIRARLLATMLALAVGTVAMPAHALPRSELPKRSRLKPIRGEPGSGAPLEERLRKANPDELKAPLPRRPRDDREAQAIETMEGLAGRYKAAHGSMSHSLRELMVMQVAEGRHSLQTHYGREIRQRQANARKLRAQAVERYADFLQLHPDDATWTPEIMFRLAELHFEGARERLARQEEAFQEQLSAYQTELEKNPDAEPPPAPKPDYTESVALYRDVVTRFPNYHLGDASLYMMGTLLYDMEEFDQSRQSYLALACRNRYEPPAQDGSNVKPSGSEPGGYVTCEPWRVDSPYAQEAWLRIGEVHYDFDQLEPALEAYEKVAIDKESDLYDEALIRKAWTLYLMRRFPEAAKTFDDFIVYADEQKRKAGADAALAGALGLRDDAVKYLAKTYVEEDWDGDNRRDKISGYARLDRDYRARGKERHVPDVYAALGDLYGFQTEYGLAIDIWNTTLQRWPLAPSAPQIQARVLEAYEMLRDKDGASRARDALATNYLRGTEWFYANENDPEAIEVAMRLAEEALVAAALDHHAKAQALRATGDPGAVREYEIAARAYRAFLERFPDAPSAYEYRFNLADALFYAGQYLESAQAYAEVRDSNLDNRLQEDAANGAILALEAHVEAQKQLGKLVVPEMPKKGAPGPFDKPQEIPAIMVTLQEAYDRFVQVQPDSEAAPTMMYLAGEVAQRYLHFGDAEQRFVQVIERHCDTNVAINAGTAILDGYVARDDLKKAQEWTQTLMEKGCGEGEEAKKFAGDLKTLGNAVRFQEATILYEAGEFEAAADRYVALVDEAPDDPNADRALNNAAVAYENIGRFGSASQTYKRIYTNYPDSEFADDALLRTGFNHSRFFEFDEAVQSYLILAEDQRYKDSEHREVALWNAADLLDNLQDYPRSAQMYQRFAAKSEDEAKAADASFKAAEVLGKTNDHRSTIKAYEGFLGRYGNDPKYADKAVASKLRIGQAHAALGNRKQAEDYYRAAVADFTTRRLQPATDAADYPSEAQFLLAEYALADVLATKITSTGKKMEKEVQDLTARLVIASKAYDEVFPYRRIDWVLAAMYRRGYAFETWAINIRQAPVPKQLKEFSEPWFAYKDIVEQAAMQAEQKALGLYEETVKRGLEYKIANEWTRAARERLNIYKPAEYPLLRRPALDMQLEDLR